MLTEREAQALQVYESSPLEAGDVVLLLDETASLEVPGLSDAWGDDLRAKITHTLLDVAPRRVVVVVARPGGELAHGDEWMWEQLVDDLTPHGVDVAPLQVLRAA